MKKLILFLLIFTLFALSSCTPISDIKEQQAVPVMATAAITAAPPPETSPSPKEPVPPASLLPEPEFITVRAVAAGDNLIHSPIYAQAHRRAVAEELEAEYNFLPAYENVMDLISAHDLAMLNQETLICNDIFEPSNYPYFNSPNALGDFMLEMGFSVFSIANNHTLDKGVIGLEACLDYWNSREAAVVGAYYNKEDRANIRTKEIGGIIFSFLSYTEHLNGLVLPSDSPLEIGNSNEIETMLEEIEKAKSISDVCVVFLHWGAENYDQIEDYQRVITSQMTEAGADIILGTHPHVLRDIEIITRANGTRAIAAYSLGNFISAQDIPQTMIGGILSFEVVMNTITKTIEFHEVKLIPTITHYDNQYTFVRIYPLSEYTAELAAAHGVRAYGEFSLEYIHRVIEGTVSGEFLAS